MPKRSGALALVALALAACPGSGGPRKSPDAAHERTVTIFGLASVRGQIEPCGCTTNPLGDLARTTAMVEEARQHGPTLVVDAGSLLYTAPKISEARKAQEELKADLLADVYTSKLKVAGLGVGPYDLALGPERVRPPRTEKPTVVEDGGVRIGILAANNLAGDATDGVKAAVAELRAQKPDAVVALLSMSRKEAKHVLEAAPGIDFAIVDLGVDAPEPEKVSERAEQVEGAWMVVPANRGQVVSRLTLTLRGAGTFADAVGPAAAKPLGAELDRRIEAAQKELDAFKADPSADPAFVAQKQQELDDLKAERQKLADQPLQLPAEGSYFTLEQVRIDRALACDLDVQASKGSYDQAAGAANVEAAKARTPSPPPAGKAAYVGSEACTDCHDTEPEFWEKTRHAEAWETLEKVGKQFDYDCIGCHVTGWDEPGGATMASNEDLRDVQCETCHGPGSLHVESEDKATARATIQREPPADLCKSRCHTPEHSDTFEYEAYMRDIVGPGHGGKKRKQLGDGPTGHDLRAAGLARAAQTIGAGCLK